MARSETKKGAGLCVGVSEYLDRKLEGCSAAVASARDIEQAIGATLIRGVKLLANPRRSDDLFLALQRSMHEAGEGTFFLYFAGFAMRKGDELLLAVGESQTDGAKGCVPWSDIEELLRREKVADALIVLNVDHFSGAPATVSAAAGVTVLGSGRAYAPSVGNTRMRGFADVVLEALRMPGVSLEKYLNDGKLDAEGLSRFLMERTAKPLRPQVFALGTVTVVVRDPSIEALPVAAEVAAEVAAAPEPKTALEPKVEEQKPDVAVVKGSDLAKPPSSARFPILLLIAAVLAAIIYWLLTQRQ